MQQPTIMDILKRLPKTNCKKCGYPTCMAFAAMVLQGQTRISLCPYADDETIARFSNAASQQAKTMETRRDEMMKELIDLICRIDFDKAARKLDASIVNGNLAVNCLGKVFELGKDGSLHSECHVNAWVHLPILNYAIHSQGRDMTGEWVTYGELKNSADWARFFSHRCEKGIKNIVEKDPGLFFDAMDMFAATEAVAKAGEAFANADYAIVIHPLPKVPMLIAYWNAENEFESKLTLFFDRSAQVNLGAESIFFLATGILEMLKRIMLRHGSNPVAP